MNDHAHTPRDPAQLPTGLPRQIQPPAAPGNQPTVPPETPPEPAATGEPPPELLALTSLDTRAGLRRMGGKADAYRKQLRRFREHYADAVDELQRLMTQQGAAPAHAWCHTLKGITGNLGATALYETLGTVDRQLRLGTLPDTALLERLRTRLREVIDDIDRLGPDAGPIHAPATEPLTSAALRTRLEPLAEALEYDLGAVESLLAQLHAGTRGTPWEGALAAIAAQAEVFAIDEALTAIILLQKQLLTDNPRSRGSEDPGDC
ncbi:hypothetical protein [uncultured Thiodictyon sp.]|uniref:hypothetical protein n=1 Tax=uncultured Thiodictyon sp. TaxID=1846217 RepID=UPI0025D03E35|nr:hypothetical protein [uncultured Thiodictyon sp.]